MTVPPTLSAVPAEAAVLLLLLLLPVKQLSPKAHGASSAGPRAEDPRVSGFSVAVAAEGLAVPGFSNIMSWVGGDGGIVGFMAAKGSSRAAEVNLRVAMEEKMRVISRAGSSIGVGCIDGADGGDPVKCEGTELKWSGVWG